MFLNKLRDEIDKIDGEMKKLFLKRMAVSTNIAELKASTGISVVDKERESQIIANLIKDTPDEYEEEYITFLKGVLKISQNHQNRIIEELTNDGKNGPDKDSDPEIDHS